LNLCAKFKEVAKLKPLEKTPVAWRWPVWAAVLIILLHALAEGLARFALWENVNHSRENFRRRHFIWSGQTGHLAWEKNNLLVNEFGLTKIEDEHFNLIRDPSKKEFRILVLGGSAVMGESREIGFNWPGELQKYLGKYNPDLHVSVLNGGFSGGLAFQERIQQQALWRYDLDLTIVYTGYNDLYYFFMDPPYFERSKTYWRDRRALVRKLSEFVAEKSVVFAWLRHEILRHASGRVVNTVSVSVRLEKNTSSVVI
jgi:hypothetical protein